MDNICIRPFTEKDSQTTAHIFFDSIHVGTQEYYTEIERAAWSPDVPELSGWCAKLETQFSLVAVQENHVIGFMTLTSEGCIDLAFLAPHVIGQGVAQKLYDEILQEAVRAKMTRIYTYASLMAHKFFLRQGWSVMHAQKVIRNNISISNFVMEKTVLETA